MIIPVGYAQANLRFTGGALPFGAEMTLGVDVTGYAGSADAAAEDIAEQWNIAQVDTIQVQSCALVEVTLKYGPNATGVTGLWTGFIAGTIVGDSVEPNTALLVHKRTAFGGRAGRGRMYMPGYPDSVPDSAGNIGAGAVATATGVFQAWFAGLTAGNLDPVLLHGAGSPISVPSPITSVVVDSRVATQRRRLRR